MSNSEFRDKHQEVMEKVYENVNASFVKRYVYRFENGTKYISTPLSFDKQREEVEKNGAIVEMLPVEMLPSDEK